MGLSSHLVHLRKWLLNHFLRLLGRLKIPDKELLYRGIHPSWIMPDGKIASAAFQNAGKTLNMSVDRQFLTTVNRSWRRLKNKGFGLMSFSAGFARSLNLNQIVRPEPSRENLAHSLVVGRKSKPFMRELAKKATWERRPAN